MTDTDHDWRHGWVPLTMRAALQKAHGNREEAARLLGDARAARRSRRTEFTSPHPVHRHEHAEKKRWARYSDDDLADELGADHDDADVERILSELDRRDRAAEKAAARAERARERRAHRRSALEVQRSRDFDAACDAGEDPETAYARVYGVTEEKIRRDQADDDLRAGGYVGKTFRDRVKHAHSEAVDESLRHAEEVCRGHMLSAAGQRAGVSPASLWSGPAATAKKYASEELRDYFRKYGRMTLEDFTAGVLGGHAKFRTTGDDW